jgi:IclR family pca regulon transcriptional regulator
MERLVAGTNESCSIAQLDGSDIVYVARVAVPKIVALSVQIGTRFPALPTSLGKILLADISADYARLPSAPRKVPSAAS